MNNPFASWTQGIATRYDNGAPFRRQEPRTLDDIDTLIQRHQNLRLSIGLERADYIEKNPELFADGEKFRIWHSKARNQSIILTIGTYIGGIGALEMFMPQLGARRFVNKYTVPVMVGMFVPYNVYYMIVARVNGYDRRLWDEYNFAKQTR